MLPTPTKTSQEALYNRNVTIPPHEDQGGGTEHGIPAGGSKDQVLAKKSDTDYDVDWKDVEGGSGVPEGGTTGQALTKKSNTDGDVEWSTIRQLPALSGVVGEGYYLSTNFMGNPMWSKKKNIEQILAHSMEGITNPFAGSGSLVVTPKGSDVISLGRAIFKPSIDMFNLLTKSWERASLENATDFFTNIISGTTFSNINSAFTGEVQLEATWYYDFDFYVAADPASPDPSTDSRIATGVFKRTNPVRLINTNTMIQFVDSSLYQTEDILMYRLANDDFDWEVISELSDQEREAVYLKMDVKYSAKIFAYPADITGALPSATFTYTIDSEQGSTMIDIVGVTPESRTVIWSD